MGFQNLPDDEEIWCSSMEEVHHFHQLQYYTWSLNFDNTASTDAGYLVLAYVHGLCLLKRITWFHFFTSICSLWIFLCFTNRCAKFRSCRTNRKGGRGNQSFRVSCLGDVGQAIQPIAFTEKALVLMLCCSVALWAMLSISPCDNNELPVLQSMFDYRAEYHKDYWPCLLSAAFISF